MFAERHERRRRAHSRGRGPRHAGYMAPEQARADRPPARDSTRSAPSRTNPRRPAAVRAAPTRRPRRSTATSTSRPRRWRTSRPTSRRRVREWVEWLLSQGARRPARGRPRRPGRRSRRSPSPSSDRTGAAPRRSHRSAPPPLEPERTAGTQLAQPLDRRLADEPAPATQAAQPAQAGACGRRAPRRGRCRRSGSSPPALTTRRDRRAAAPQRIATPYDFDGDGKQELVLGMPVGGGAEGREAERACVGPERAHPEAAAPTDHAVGRWRCVAGSTARCCSAAVSRAPTSTTTGGRTWRSGPRGRELVSVLYGSSAGLLNGSRRHDRRRSHAVAAGAQAGTATGSRRATSTTTASATSSSAPPGCRARRRSGAVQLIFGSPTGLQIDKPRTIRRPDDTYVEFGSRLRGRRHRPRRQPRSRRRDLPTGQTRRRPGTACTAVGRRTDRPAAGRWAPTPEEARRRSRSPTSTATGSTTSCRATPIPCRRTPWSAAARSGCGAAASAGRATRAARRSTRTQQFVDGDRRAGRRVRRHARRGRRRRRRLRRHDRRRAGRGRTTRAR